MAEYIKNYYGQTIPVVGAEGSESRMRSLTLVHYFATMDETALFLSEHSYVSEIVNVYDFTSYLYLTADGTKTLLQHIKGFLQENSLYDL